MAFRVVQQSMWTDEKVIDNYSAEDKYFWLYLLTNPQCNQLGIYKLPIKIAAFQLGYSREQVMVLLERFDKKLHQIKYNFDTQEIAIGNYLYHSIISGGKPVFDAILKDANKISDKSLFVFVIEKMSKKDITNKTVESGIRLLKDKCNLPYEDDNDNENDKHNDNDNDDTPTNRGAYRNGELFEKFWNAYPRKVGKGAAEKAFKKYKPDDTLLSVMLSALSAQKRSEQWHKDGGQFIPYPATWLNQRRWEDDTGMDAPDSDGSPTEDGTPPGDPPELPPDIARAKQQHEEAMKRFMAGECGWEELVPE